MVDRGLVIDPKLRFLRLPPFLRNGARIGMGLSGLGSKIRLNTRNTSFFAAFSIIRVLDSRMRELARQRPTSFQLDVAISFTRESSGQVPRPLAVVVSLP